MASLDSVLLEIKTAQTSTDQHCDQLSSGKTAGLMETVKDQIKGNNACLAHHLISHNI